MSRRNARFSSVRTEGSLLPRDMLSRIHFGDRALPGLTFEDYHLQPRERIGEAVNRAWNRLTVTWRAFEEARDSEPTTAATRITRERWLLPLFQELGYGRLQRNRAVEVDGKSFPVSHLWHQSPIHLLGTGVDLDRRQPGVAGAARTSPHGLVQQFLNRSDDHLWGFVSNGLQFRVLRDHHSITRQAYIEFDLQAIMQGDQFSDFLLLWLICHQSRVEAEKPEDCWLEHWFNLSREEGVRAFDKLRDGVERAIEILGNGFLAEKSNRNLQTMLKSGELHKQEYYHQILRLVYRFIFLFVAEERDVLLDRDAEEVAKNRYLDFYGVRRLRELAEKRRGGGSHVDLWQGLHLVMSKLDNGCEELALPALGSFLWGPDACPILMESNCENEYLLDAIRNISTTKEGTTRYPVDWRNIGSDELGSIYEGLLELHPQINREAASFTLDTTVGSERKTTGSYYTPRELVDCLLDSALEPVLDRAAGQTHAEEAILALKICDPACGSGHFLIAAAHRIAVRLAAVRVGEDEPSPSDVRHALRDVVGHCIFGVDINPMAVELCKISLWMEAIEPGHPLPFLDAHIRCGNALLGTTPALMSRGIPDAAFKFVQGDDQDVIKRLKRRNQSERKGQGTFNSLLDAGSVTRPNLFAEVASIETMPDYDIDSVREKEQLWKQFSDSPQNLEARERANLWCAAFLGPRQIEFEDVSITWNVWKNVQQDLTTAPSIIRQAATLCAQRHQFFHWHVEFPQVFKNDKEDINEEDVAGWDGGFDAVLGNPPWERIKIQEREWFATRSEAVVEAGTANARRRAIADLEESDPVLWGEWQLALRLTGEKSHLIHDTGRYPLGAVGDINTYALFAELNATITAKDGQVGCIVPTGIATDETYSKFFQYMWTTKQLASLYDFQNREKFFPAVSTLQNFCLLTLKRDGIANPAEFLFYGNTVTDIADSDRRFQLEDRDIMAINPNSQTCPIFRTRRDAEIARQVYASIPVMSRKTKNVTSPGNLWGIQFHRLFDMTNDAALFRNAQELENDGWKISGNHYYHPGQDGKWAPVYEGKMVSAYDHRAANIVFNSTNTHRPQQPELNPTVSKEDPHFVPRPYLWGPVEEGRTRTPDNSNQNWYLTFKRVTAATNERTMIGCVIPWTVVSYTLYVVTWSSEYLRLGPCLAASLYSFAADFFVRQKTTQPSLPMGVVYESPLPPPSVFEDCAPWDPSVQLSEWIRPRVLELSYTAWDLEDFAKDQGYDGPPFKWDEERRFWIRAELDAALFYLYGISREDIGYIMGTFPSVQRREEEKFGSYKTKEAILEIHDQFTRAIAMEESYRTKLNPPPGDIRAAHEVAM